MAVSSAVSCVYIYRYTIQYLTIYYSVCEVLLFLYFLFYFIFFVSRIAKIVTRGNNIQRIQLTSFKLVGRRLDMKGNFLSEEFAEYPFEVAATLRLLLSCARICILFFFSLSYIPTRIDNTVFSACFFPATLKLEYIRDYVCIYILYTRDRVPQACENPILTGRQQQNFSNPKNYLTKTKYQTSKFRFIPKMVKNVSQYICNNHDFCIVRYLIKVTAASRQCYWHSNIIFYLYNFYFYFILRYNFLYLELKIIITE